MFDLPKLSPQDFVNVNDRNIRKKGQILKSNNTPRSYVVKTDTDIITRNRKHLLLFLLKRMFRVNVV